MAGWARGVAAAALVAANVVRGDVYLHNPRGSNNRLDEARRDRNNANRLFDSQNNNRGGSNVGSLYFYEGEKVPMEWTNQHGCGNTANDCQVVVQYMCDERLRDGVTTRTIPQTPAQCLNNDCNSDVRYGMHESYDYYMNCKYRFRNRGLFTADRNVNGNTAIYTRQNNNGNRRGYECPEERDHYPYWHPTPWIDLAIATNNPSRCSWYQQNSENVAGRSHCALPDAWYHHMVSRGGNGRNGFIPNTESRCLGLNAPTSGMMTYLSTRAAAVTQQLEAVVDAEYTRCTDQMEIFQSACLNEDISSCNTYTNFFGNANNFVTAAAMEAQCPQCPSGGVLHPDSACPTCGPSTCGAATTFVRPDNVTNTCPTGYVADTLSMQNTQTYNGPVCATENGQCTCDGYVTYGAGGVWSAPRLVNGTIGCSNSVFGDVRPGVRKQCRCSPPPTTTWCVTAQCADQFVARTTEEMASVDTCRANLVGSTKILVRSLGTGMYECATRNVTSTECRAAGTPARWVEEAPHAARIPGLQAPACQMAQWARPNHLGNGIGGQQNGWNLTVPSHIHERCAIRVRYNITTLDYGGLDHQNSGEVNSTLNKRNGGNPAKVNVGANFDIAPASRSMPYENVRGYLWKQNPRVTIFDYSQLVMYCTSIADEADWVNGFPTRCTSGQTIPYSAFCPAGTTNVIYSPGTSPTNLCNTNFCNVSGVPRAGTQCQHRTFNNGNTGLRNQGTNANGDIDFRLQLAINTNQFGRTFQDRTHSHAIRAVSEELRQECRRIHALNVRGKRGNVVQTFPGTEYDFVPNILEVARGDCVHFQWTGSNTNPNNNDGQGKRGTDRSNVALLENVRGQGGRGVLRYGGYGRDGTTWTTANMEPGYEGYRANQVPTMFDLQCSSNTGTGADYRPHNVPGKGWQYCSNCPASDFRGTTAPDTTTCPASYTYVDRIMMCVRNTASCTYSRRAQNPTTFSGVGLDNRDPSFGGFGSGQIGVIDSMKFGGWGNSHPEHLDNVTRWGVWGMSYANFQNLATLTNVQFRGEMSELDDAGTYFDLPPQRIGGPTGSMYYMCTRNNNFSNRSQKGKITVSDNVEESTACSATGCAVEASSSPLLASGMQVSGSLQSVTEGSAAIVVPPNSLTKREQVAVQMLPGMGMTDGASDAVMFGPGNLQTQQSFQAVQLQLSNGRRRDHHMSGIWVEVQQESVGGNSLFVKIHSPSSGVIQSQRETIWGWLEAMGLQTMSPYLCLTLKYGSQMWPITLDIPMSNTLQYEVTIPDSEVESVNRALWAGNLGVEIGFPADSNIVYGMNVSTRTCSATPYSATVPIDEESGKPIKITIPVAAAFTYGPIYRWPINNKTTACFRNGIDCDSVYTDDSRETISDATCGGGQCEVERQQAGGYYQVSSANTIGLIVGITFGCLILMALMIGSALYFRRNPEKWADFKAWGPNKYKQIELSFKGRI